MTEHRYVNPWIIAVSVMFATFMEVACCDAFRPDWQRWVAYGLERSAAFEVDSPGYDRDSLRRSISSRLVYSMGKDPITATKRDWFVASVFAVRDRLVERWMPWDALAAALPDGAAER